MNQSKSNKAQVHFKISDIIFGLLIIAGGVLVVFSKINFGIALTSLGATLEAFKLLIEKGL